MVTVPPITRKQVAAVSVGPVTVGGGAPVVVQSMTDTPTADIDATVAQIKALADAGSEIVRLTVNDERAAQAVPYIKERLRAARYDTPLAGCFHYNGHTLLRDVPACAEALDKYRINPGNVGFGKGKDARFLEIIDIALRYDKPVRIGVNWGSLDASLSAAMMDENAALPNPEPAEAVLRAALVRSALESAEKARAAGMAENKIILSCKVSKARDLMAVYRALSAACSYPLHLGLTEAGGGIKGAVSSTAALAPLLLDGIGDTIRISLTPGPGQERSEEVRIARAVLQSLDIRRFAPDVTSCPGCGRTSSVYFRELADGINLYLEKAMAEWKTRYPGAETLSVAVMGCIVNGPGESKHADIGISLPGDGESPAAPVFIDGVKAATLRGDNIAQEFTAMIEAYVQARFGGGGQGAKRCY